VTPICCRDRSAESASEAGWWVPHLVADHAAEVAPVGEAEVGGQPGQLLLAGGQAIQRGPGPEAHAVSGHGMAGGGAKGPAELCRRHVQRGRQVGQRTVRIGRHSPQAACPHRPGGVARQQHGTTLSREFRQEHGTTSSPVVGPPGVHQQRCRCRCTRRHPTSGPGGWRWRSGRCSCSRFERCCGCGCGARGSGRRRGWRGWTGRRSAATWPLLSSSVWSVRRRGASVRRPSAAHADVLSTHGEGTPRGRRRQDDAGAEEGVRGRAATAAG
jgi:hypothetical protein